MDSLLTKGEKNLALLQSLLFEQENLYITCYTKHGTFVASSCPIEIIDVFDSAFRLFHGMEKVERSAPAPEEKRPVLIGSGIGMQWAAVYEQERKETLIYVIGPVLYNPPEESDIRNALRPLTNSMEDQTWINRFLAALPSVPVLSYSIFTRYVTLIHNTLNSDTMTPAGIFAPKREEVNPSPSNEIRDRTSVYRAEKAMLDMVRQGDINYLSVLQRSSVLSPGVPVKGADPLRQSKTSIIVFTSLVCRAAMEGGLPPETAYALGDSYIQAAEDCRDSAELSALSSAMYHDFIYRVHQLQISPDYSPAVMKCIDYIDLNLERKLQAKDLALLTGYTEYYLTEKFRNETGESLNTYIRERKIRRAQMYLESEDTPIAEIAERLAFNTVNYFIRCFKEATGMTPAKYRSLIRSGREDARSDTPAEKGGIRSGMPGRTPSNPGIRTPHTPD